MTKYFFGEREFLVFPHCVAAIFFSAFSTISHILFFKKKRFVNQNLLLYIFFSRSNESGISYLAFLTCTIYLGDFPQTFVMRNYGKWQKLVSNQMLLVERSHVEKYCFSFPRAPQDHSFKDSDLRRVKALEMNSLTYDLKKVFMK